jgi:four helix bundle suffix protein
MGESEPLIPKHGGYRRLKSFQLAQLIYDVTVRFCERYIDQRSRTHDQMVQAARSGTQNIAEGSQASGTSKKTELKLTNVARSSLEELRLDYQDYLRQRGLAEWPPGHPALRRFKARRCATLGEVQAWVADERRLARTGKTPHGQARTVAEGHGQARTGTVGKGPARTGTDSQGQTGGHPSVEVGVGPWASVPGSAHLAANAALSLLNLCCRLVDRQLAAQERAFVEEGGFTERLYRVRSRRRQSSSPPGRD